MSRQLAIYNLYPTVRFATESSAIDDDGNEVTVDEDLVSAEVTRLQLADYENLRIVKYPKLGELADAIYWKEKGDNSKMTAWVSACEKVKSDLPKA
tara:strand:+ start:501 stop:788 length:288 start_codon:yes stop_codon:yes gene_type:complete